MSALANALLYWAAIARQEPSDEFAKAQALTWAGLLLTN